MLRVGIVGWRGMVGSVLVQRMREEKDFDHIEPVFFSTSQAGGKGPSIGKDTGPVQDANSVKALKAHGVEFVESSQLHPEDRGALTRSVLGSVAFELVHK